MQGVSCYRGDGLVHCYGSPQRSVNKNIGFVLVVGGLFQATQWPSKCNQKRMDLGVSQSGVV